MCVIPDAGVAVIKKGTFLTYRGDKSRCIYKNSEKISETHRVAQGSHKTYIKKRPGIMKDETIYHIYAKNVCLYPCLKEEEFKIKWAELKGMVGLMKTDYI